MPYRRFGWSNRSPSNRLSKIIVTRNNVFNRIRKNRFLMQLRNIINYFFLILTVGVIIFYLNKICAITLTREKYIKLAFVIFIKEKLLSWNLTLQLTNILFFLNIKPLISLLKVRVTNKHKGDDPRSKLVFGMSVCGISEASFYF